MNHSEINIITRQNKCARLLKHFHQRGIIYFIGAEIGLRLRYRLKPASFA